MPEEHNGKLPEKRQNKMVNLRSKTDKIEMLELGASRGEMVSE